MSLRATDLTLHRRLAGVTATLHPGEITAICGPNGAGKSTLLGALAGLIVPTQGVVELDASPLAQLLPAARARAIGFLPQQGDLAWDLSVEALVGLGRIPWPGTPGRAEIEAALVAMDLAPLRHRAVTRLSGGERARALMARVLAGEPAWLLADEPLASLDLAHAQTLIALLKDQARGGIGVVMVLHDLAMAMNHAARVLVLHQGRLVADGPPDAALTPAVIARVWGVSAQWLGGPGKRALALG